MDTTLIPSVSYNKVDIPNAISKDEAELNKLITKNKLNDERKKYSEATINNNK